MAWIRLLQTCRLVDSSKQSDPNAQPSMSESPVRHFRWSDVPEERVTDVISRKLITGDDMMLAQVFLKKDALVPQHSHHNEQLTYIVSGALHFYIGADRATEVIVRAGEVLHLPSNVPHEARALEDTLDVDIFSPPRQDWLDGTDSYFHRK
jgi:quercetin dioxygenase-like cupin family protein